MSKKFICAVINRELKRASGKIIFKNDYFEIVGNTIHKGLYYRKAEYNKVFYSNIECVHYSMGFLSHKVEFKFWDEKDTLTIFINSFSKRNFLQALKASGLEIKYIK